MSDEKQIPGTSARTGRSQVQGDAAALRREQPCRAGGLRSQAHGQRLSGRHDPAPFREYSGFLPS